MKSFNARKTLCVLLLIPLSCLSFCACRSEALPESSDISQTAVKFDTYQTEGESAAEKTEAYGEEIEGEIISEPFSEVTFESVVIKEEDFYFAPVITEDDIEYMGIPYKDLTQEQFIQLWAQCTRECNVQRLYNLYYSNQSYDNTFSEEERAKLSNEDVRDWLQTLLKLELKGRMLHGYHDVELHEIEDAPEGYYDNKETEELRYIITYKSKMYEQGKLSYEGSDIRWITLKKINGYWKIGLSFSSSL